MAFLGLRTKDAGLGGGSTADLLIKALTGDPEREMALARGRADLDLNKYRQRQMEAAAAQAQAEADTKTWELHQRETNLPTMSDYYAGLVEEPVPVITPGATPAPAPGLPDPVAVDPMPLPLPDYAFGGPSGTYHRQPEITAAAAPDAAIEYGPDVAPVAVSEDTLQLPQPDVQPGASIPVSPEEQAAYEREVAAARARAGLIIGGGGNAAQMGQGLGIGEGIIKSGSSDPETRQQGNVLYTGTNPPAGGAGGVPNTEAGGNARLYAGMMLDSELLLKEATPENVPDLVTTLAGLPDENITMSMITNLAVDPASKRYLAAAYRWTIAQLRKTTGATINKSELAGTLQSYIPLAGDSAQGIVEKERARRVFEHGLVEQGYGYQSAEYKAKIAEFQRLYGIDLTDAGTTDTGTADDNIPIIDPNTPAGDAIYDRLPAGTQYRLPGSDEIHTKTAEN